MSLRVRETMVPASGTTSDRSPPGIWFQTRGWKDPPLDRQSATTSGAMLSRETKWKAESPPPQFNQLSQETYSEVNTFSMHDNRNSFQDHGVYFGHGLGKRLSHGKERQHSSEDTLTWNSPERHYDTSTGSIYTGRPCTEPPTTRRFPRVHPAPTEGPAKLSSSATDWFQPPDVPYKTDTQVLVSSQEPHLKPNLWKYSQKPGY